MISKRLSLGRWLALFVAVFGLIAGGLFPVLALGQSEGDWERVDTLGKEWVRRMRQTALLVEQDRLNEAVRVAKKALEAARRLKRAELGVRSGVIHFRQKNVQFVLLLEARDVRESIRSTILLDQCSRLGVIALLYAECEDFQTALALAQEARQAATGVRGQPDWEVAEIRFLVKQIEILQQLSPAERDELVEAGILGRQAVRHQDMGNFARAEPLLIQAMKAIKRTVGEDHPRYADALIEIAVNHREQGNYVQAESLLQLAIRIIKRNFGEDHPRCKMRLNDLALPRGVPRFSSIAESILQQTQAEDLKAPILDLGQDSIPAESILQQTQAEDLKTPILDLGQDSIPEDLQNLKPPRLVLDSADLEVDPYKALLYGSWDLLFGQYGEAEVSLERSVQIAKETLGEKHPDYALFLNNRAGSYHLRYAYTQADSLYKQALQIIKRPLGEEDPDHAMILGNLATLYRHQEAYAQAEPLYQRAMDIIGRTLGEECTAYATALDNLALNHKAQGQYDSAEPLFQQALKITREIHGEKHDDYAERLNNLAGLYQAQGAYDKAEPLLERALQITSPLFDDYETVDSGSVLILNNLATLHRDQGAYDKAEPLLRKSVQFQRKDLDEGLVGLSEHRQLVMSERQRFYLDNYLSVTAHLAKSQADAYKQVIAWKGAVFAHQQKLLGDAREPELFPLFQQLQTVRRRLAKLSLQITDPRQPRRYRERIAQYYSEIDMLEAKLSHLGNPYGAASVEITLESLQMHLPSGAVLVDFLESRQPVSSRGHDTSSAQFERHLLAFVVRRDASPRQIDLGPVAPIEAAIAVWREALGVGLQAEAAVNKLRVLLWEQLTKHFNDVQLLIVSPDGILADFPLGALPGEVPGSYLIEELPVLVMPVPRLLPSYLKKQSESVSPKEASWIVESIGTAPIFVLQIPPRLLLILRNLPVSLSAIAPPENSSLLVVGNIDFEASPSLPFKSESELRTRGRRNAIRSERGAIEGFSPLPRTKDEAEEIVRLFVENVTPKPGQVTKLFGDEATEEAFREEATGRRYLHVATHGYFAPTGLASALEIEVHSRKRYDESEGSGEGIMEQPRTRHHPGLLSGLAFAGANRPTPPAVKNGDDGIFTALEVAALDLRGTDLVVLSACETGLGRVAGGEGVLGLQRAFQMSGAKTTVTSLWNVDDRATQTLMVEFYRNLWERKLPKLEALRQAQLKMLRHYDSAVGQLRDPSGRLGAAREPEATDKTKTKVLRTPPAYWAGWVLSGDPGELEEFMSNDSEVVD